MSECIRLQGTLPGLRCPGSHPVSKPCIPVRAALLHLLHGQLDCLPPCSLQRKASMQDQW